MVDGTRGFYVKMANVQWKNLIPYAKLTFGQQAPPTFVPIYRISLGLSIHQEKNDHGYALHLEVPSDMGIQL